MEKEVKDMFRAKVLEIIGKDEIVITDVLNAYNEAVVANLKLRKSLRKRHDENLANLCCQVAAKIIHSTPEAIKSKLRRRKLVYARYVIYEYLRREHGMILSNIGEFFLGDNRYKKDHATVLHGISKLKILISQKDSADIKSIYSKFNIEMKEIL